MKLPKSFRLFGKPWTIKRRKLKESGNCCHYKAEVQLDPRKTSSGQIKTTLLHEVVHAIEGDMDIKISEKDVNRISVGLYAWMKDNPKVVKWLLKN